MTNPVRVLVVDDSALMRKLIPQILATDSSIQVVGTAMDGNFGLKKIEELKPQVVTLDLEMPGMGGLDMLKEIMRAPPRAGDRGELAQHPGGVGDAQGAVHGRIRFRGQADRRSARMPEIAQELIAKIKAAALSRGTKLASPDCRPLLPATKPRPASTPCRREWSPSASLPADPQALQYLLPQLPKDFPGSHLDRAAHARGIHRNVFAPPGRNLRHSRKRSAIGRFAAGRARVGLSRKPAHESETHLEGPGGAFERRTAGQWTSALGGCAVPERGRRIWQRAALPC